MNRDFIRYNYLENRIDQVKARLTKLLDYYNADYVDIMDSNNNNLGDEDDEDNFDDYQSFSNSNWSLQSFYSLTDFDNGSMHSYVTAFDYVEEPKCSAEPKIRELSTPDNIINEYFNESPKKCVTFDKNVAIFETPSFYPSASKTKRLSKHIKSKMSDFFEYEKFMIRYKWYKLKRGIQKFKKPPNRSATNKSNQTTYDESDESMTISCVGENTNNNSVKTVDLYVFFSKYFETYLIETDVDNNQCHVLYFQFPLQKTDLNFDLISSTHNDDTHKSDSSKSNELVAYTHPTPNDSLVSNDNWNTININSNNVLFKYLVLKAQSPIERKIATSVIKLSLPLWYQNSLII